MEENKTEKVKWKFISQGSSRLVYEGFDGEVPLVAKVSKGKKANKVEAEIHKILYKNNKFCKDPDFVRYSYCNKKLLEQFEMVSLIIQEREIKGLDEYITYLIFAFFRSLLLPIYARNEKKNINYFQKCKVVGEMENYYQFYNNHGRTIMEELYLIGNILKCINNIFSINIGDKMFVWASKPIEILYNFDIVGDNLGICGNRLYLIDYDIELIHSIITKLKRGK